MNDIKEAAPGTMSGDGTDAAEVALRAVHRVYHSAMEDLEVLIKELRDYGQDGGRIPISDVKATIRKLDDATLLFAKEKQKVDERLGKFGDGRERFQLDLGAARTQVADRLARLAAARGVG